MTPTRQPNTTHLLPQALTLVLSDLIDRDIQNLHATWHGICSSHEPSALAYANGITALPQLVRKARYRKELCELCEQHDVLIPRTRHEAEKMRVLRQLRIKLWLQQEVQNEAREERDPAVEQRVDWGRYAKTGRLYEIWRDGELGRTAGSDDEESVQEEGNGESTSPGDSDYEYTGEWDVFHKAEEFHRYCDACLKDRVETLRIEWLTLALVSKLFAETVREILEHQLALARHQGDLARINSDNPRSDQGVCRACEPSKLLSGDETWKCAMVTEILERHLLGCGLTGGP